MSERPKDRIESDDEVDEPSSERDVEALQRDQDGSAAFQDPTIDRAEVRLLPGTGDPDDPGDIEVEPGEIHLPHLPGRTEDGPPA